MNSRRPFFAILLIGLGVVFLLRNFGFIPHDFIRQWWPLLLVAIGVGILFCKGNCKR